MLLSFQDACMHDIFCYEIYLLHPTSTRHCRYMHNNKLNIIMIAIYSCSSLLVMNTFNLLLHAPCVCDMYRYIAFCFLFALASIIIYY